MSFRFSLIGVDDAGRPAVVFSDTAHAGLVPLWEMAGVYASLYNSDGKQAREVSRALAYGLDMLQRDPRIARALPPTSGASAADAVRFLENVLRACTRHARATIETT